MTSQSLRSTTLSNFTDSFVFSSLFQGSLPPRYKAPWLRPRMNCPFSSSLLRPPRCRALFRASLLCPRRKLTFTTLSHPRLVARSSTPTTPWTEPSGMEAYHLRKELKAVDNHALNDVWEDTLAPLVFAILESEKVKFTSVDVVRIGIIGEPSPPV